MKFMDYDTGFANGQYAVENYQGLNVSIADYKEEVEEHIRQFEADANAYRSGYMAGVKAKLEELEESNEESEA